MSTLRALRTARERQRATFQQTPFGFRLAGLASAVTGTFEPQETTLLQSELPHADVFVDVGANVGYYTCLARALGKQAVAIEPLVDNLHFLYGNLLANEWGDTQVLPVGLAEQPGLVRLFGGNTGASLVERWADSPTHYGRTIAVTTLDQALAGQFSGARLVIKIDVEGAELRVLRGATATLRRTPAPVWLIEVCFRENQPGGAVNPDFQTLFDLMSSHGYDSIAVTPEGPIKISVADVQRWLSTGRRELEVINYIFRMAP